MGADRLDLGTPPWERWGSFGWWGAAVVGATTPKPDCDYGRWHVFLLRIGVAGG